MRAIITSALFMASAGTFFAQSSIVTVAGGGTNTSGAPAAPGFIGGIAVDSSGAIYLSFTSANIIMKLGASGTLTAVAGTGIAGFSGDNGPATSAQLNGPLGLSFDSTGNLYIADNLNNRIRRVSNGVITTFAGDGTYSVGGDGGLATVAQVEDPISLAFDGSNNLYILEGSQSGFFPNTNSPGPYIREVSKGYISSVVCGLCPTFIRGLSTQLGYQIAVDAQGVIWLEDQHLNNLWKIANGSATRIAGNDTPGFGGDGGPATSGLLNDPIGVAVDGSGNVYVADAKNNRIRRINQGGTISTIAGNGAFGFSGDNGPATSAELASPSVLTVDGNGKVYIVDSGNQRIRRVSNGTITTILESGIPAAAPGSIPATSVELGLSPSVAIDSHGNLFIADAGSQLVRQVSAGAITIFAGTGTQGYSGDGGAATSAQLNSPTGLFVDNADNLFIADTGNNRIRKITNGTISTVAGNGTQGFSGDGGPATSAALNMPVGIVTDSTGILYIADAGNQAIRKVSGGTITTLAGNGVAGSPCDNNGDPVLPPTLFQGNFKGPTGLAIDSSGNLFIADTGNHEIVEFVNGKLVPIAGNCDQVDAGPGGGFGGDGGPASSALLNFPTGVAVDNNGNVFISDGLNQRIRKVTNGIITTVAGNGSPGSSGDGGAATAAELTYPSGVAVDANGTLYIADLGNNRIRMVAVVPAITSFDPGSAFAGGAAFTLKVTGVTFQRGSIINWNGSALTTTYISTTQLSAAVSNSLIASPAAAKITVVNGQGLASTSASFQIVAPFAVSAAPSSVTIAAPGGNGNTTVSVTPATGFSGNVAVSCVVAFKGQGTANDPPKCSPNPTQLSLAAPTVSTITVSIGTTAAQQGALKHLPNSIQPFRPLVLAVLLFASFMRARRVVQRISLMLAVLCVAALVSSCGGGGGGGPKDPGTTAGSYTITLTATSGGFSGTANVSLTVQ